MVCKHFLKSLYKDEIYHIIRESDNEPIGSVDFSTSHYPYAEIRLYYEDHGFNVYPDGKIERTDYDSDHIIIDDHRCIVKEIWTTTVYDSIDYYTYCPDLLYSIYKDIIDKLTCK